MTNQASGTPTPPHPLPAATASPPPAATEGVQAVPAMPALPGAVMRVLAQRPLVAGETVADYDDLFGRVAAAVAPADAIEWIWVKDVVDLVWEARRLRRMRDAVLTTARLEALAHRLSPILKADGRLEAAASAEAGRLARGWTRGEPRARLASPSGSGR